MPATNPSLSTNEWRSATDHYGPWIHSKARRIASQLPGHVARNLYEDLVGVGFKGFVEAMQRLDPSRPECAEAYVKQLITGAMLDELRRLDPLSRDQRRRQRELREVERGLTRRLGRPPVAEEMARAAGISVEQYRKLAAEAAPTMVSLDAPLAGEGDALVDLLSRDGELDPQEGTLELERWRLLEQALDGLTDVQRMVVQRYYFEGDTLQSIGSGLNVCAARASQIRKEAVNRIREDISHRLAS
jgi:RNA polymerase sigma factor for flagellar operon FliA